MIKEFMVNEAAIYMKATNGVACHDPVRGVSIDSRLTRSGDLFFALKGRNTDGHLFVDAAEEKGAVAAVVQQKSAGRVEIMVHNTLSALGDLAGAQRDLFNGLVIGITGTNGKTTVKNLVAAIMRKKYRVIASERNFNSLIGLPLTIFNIKGDEDFLIAEMGTSNKGEIRRLCEIVRPTYGLVTNIGPGHLEGLTSVEDVKKEKLALIESLPAHGFGVVNAAVGAIETGSTVYRFAPGLLGDVQIDESGSSFTYQSQPFSTPLLGPGNVDNCLAALVLTTKLGIDVDLQRSALKEIRPEPGRFEPIRVKDLLVINDTYNANPASMQSAIDFAGRSKRRRIFILGDMLELGRESESYHEKIGVAARANCELLLTLGEAARSYQGKHFTAAKELVDYLMDNINGNEIILVKASRGLKFENIVNEILRG